jgi:hypothetical protein
LVGEDRGSITSSNKISKVGDTFRGLSVADLLLEYVALFDLEPRPLTVGTSLGLRFLPEMYPASLEGVLAIL